MMNPANETILATRYPETFCAGAIDSVSKKKWFTYHYKFQNNPLNLKKIYFSSFEDAVSDFHKGNKVYAIGYDILENCADT